MIISNGPCLRVIAALLNETDPPNRPVNPRWLFPATGGTVINAYPPITRRDSR